MKNQIITNKQGSIVALAPLLDATGNVLVLQPKGAKGDAREITATVANDEIIKRVEKAGWVYLRLADTTPAPNNSVSAAPPAPVEAPPTTPTVPAAPPAPGEAPLVPHPEPVTPALPIESSTSAVTPEETVQTTVTTTVETTTTTTDVGPAITVEPPAKAKRQK